MSSDPENLRLHEMVARTLRNGGPSALLYGSGRRVASGASGAMRRLAGEFGRRRDMTVLTEAQLSAGAANETLRDRHTGRPAFVMGNGPSLKAFDLAPLADQVTFVGNAFWRHPITTRADWSPTYYCFIDDLLFSPDPGNDEFFAQLRERCEGTTFIARSRLAEVARQRGFFGTAPVFEVPTAGRMTEVGLSRIDLTAIMPAVESVLVLELMAAVYMGCNPIYLLGADHDWLAHDGTHGHFYSDIRIEADVAPMPTRSEYLRMMAFCERLWSNHVVVRDLANARGVTIYNATGQGPLDVYPLVRFEDALREVAS